MLEPVDADEVAERRRRKLARAEIAQAAAADAEAARQMIAHAQDLIDWGPATDALLAAVAAAELEQHARRVRRDGMRAAAVAAVEASSALFAIAGDCRRTASELRALPVDDTALRRAVEHLARVAHEHPDDLQTTAVAALLDAALGVGYGPALFTAIEAFSALPFDLRRRLLQRTRSATP